MAPVALEQLAGVRARPAANWSRAIPGSLLEDKGAGLALHFLKAPQLEHQLRAEVAVLAAPLVPEFALLDGHAVIEVKPAAHTKDSAVTAFMAGGAVSRPHADLHRRRPDRLRRIRGGAALRRPGDRRRTAREIGVVAAGPGRRARWLEQLAHMERA